MAVNMYNKVIKRSKYYDRTLFNSYEEWAEYVNLSNTVYVGNLSVYTTDREIFEYMSKVGPVETIIVGLHRVEKTPCGFCFVVYKSKKSCEMAVNILNETILDGRVIKVDEDIGVIGERRYGRGVTGVQRIDERLKQFDFDRPVVLDNLIQTESLRDHINNNNILINSSNKNYNSNSSSTSSINNNNNYNINNNYNNNNINNNNNNNKTVYLRTNEDYVDIKNNNNCMIDNPDHRINTIYFNNKNNNNNNHYHHYHHHRRNNYNNYNNYKYKNNYNNHNYYNHNNNNMNSININNNNMNNINNNNFVCDIAESVFAKHQINYSRNNNYDYDDEDSADKKHERFKAVQRENRMKVDMLVSDKENVDNTVDMESHMIKRDGCDDDNLKPTNTNINTDTNTNTNTNINTDTNTNTNINTDTNTNTNINTNTNTNTDANTNTNTNTDS